MAQIRKPARPPIVDTQVPHDLLAIAKTDPKLKNRLDKLAEAIRVAWSDPAKHPKTFLQATGQDGPTVVIEGQIVGGGKLFKARFNSGDRVPVQMVIDPYGEGIILVLWPKGDHDAGDQLHREGLKGRERYELVSLEEEDGARLLPVDLRQFKHLNPLDLAFASTHRELRGDPTQQDYAAQQPPLLLRGSAGTGKTTVLLLHYWAEKRRNKRVRYVTFHRQLRDHCMRLSREHLGEDGDDDFVVLEDLCLSLLKSRAGVGRLDDQRATPAEEFPPDGRVGKEHFLRLPAIAALPHRERVWEEIRAVLRGDPRLIEREHLRKVFQWNVEQPVRKRKSGPRIPTVTGGPTAGHLARLAGAMVLSREGTSGSVLGEAHDAYRQWRNFKDEQTRLRGIPHWDDLDLAFATLQELEFQPLEALYDDVVCDEVQDLTLPQIAVLTRIVHKGQVYLAGDEMQIIHPSGFQWNRVSSLIYAIQEERAAAGDYDGSYKTLPLTKNYRSSASIVALLNSLSHWRAEHLHDPESKSESASDDQTNTVSFCSVSAAGELALTYKRLPAQVMVIVPGPEYLEKARELFGGARVFTVHEAKGIERPYIVTWQLFKEFGPLLKRATEPNPTETDCYKARYAANCVNVALSRAMQGLLICEGPLVEIPFLAGIDDERPDILENLFRLREGESVYDIYTNAQEHEEAGRLEAALEDYREIASLDDVHRCEAKIKLLDGDDGAAGELFLKAREYEDALKYLLRATKRHPHYTQSAFEALMHVKPGPNFEQALLELLNDRSGGIVGRASDIGNAVLRNGDRTDIVARFMHRRLGDQRGRLQQIATDLRELGLTARIGTAGANL